MSDLRPQGLVVNAADVGSIQIAIEVAVGSGAAAAAGVLVWTVCRRLGTALGRRQETASKR